MSPNSYLAQEVWAPQVKTLFHSQLSELVRVNQAHGMMLVKQGLLSKEEYRIISYGFAAAKQAMKEENLNGEYGDLYFNLMQRMYSIVGQEVGCKIHVGRSRNDICGACNRLQIRRDILELLEIISNLMAKVLQNAVKYKNAVITYNTYGQPAQPGTFGHYLLVVFSQFERDFIRLKAAFANANRSPAGASAGIGTSFPLDREYTAKLLGFDGIVDNTLDAISSVDYILECEAAVSIMMVNISRLAQDLLHWANYESHIIDLDESVTGGSSIMPQKKNPVCFEHMRAQSARAAGMFADAIAMVRNTTVFPCSEGSVDIYCDFSTWMEEVKKAIHLLSVGLDHSTMNEQLAEEEANNNYTTASSIAEHLARMYDIPFIDAHHIVHDSILLHTENGDSGAFSLKAELLAKASEKYLKEPLKLNEDTMKKLLSARYCLAEIAVSGGPDPVGMERMIQKSFEVLENQRQWLNSVEDKLQSAEVLLSQGL